MRSRRFVIAIAIVVGLVGLRLGVNVLLRKKKIESKPVLSVVHPAYQELDNSLNLPGNVEAIQEAKIYAHVSGYLKKLYVDEGDRVKKGQLMAVIDAPDIVQEDRKAKAEADLKVTTRDRYKSLLQDRVVSQQEFDTINADANEALARLANADANVSYTEIRAPFSGSVARRFKYPGDLISATSSGSTNDNPIFIVVNESELRIAINIPQVDISNVKMNDTTEVFTDASKGKAYNGKVSRIDALLDEATKTQRVLVDLDNKDGSLHAGMFATVALHFDHKDHALSIPKDAVEDSPQGQVVWAVRDGKLKKVHVAIGLKTTNLIEVTNGLSPADQVVAKASDVVFPEDTSVEARLQ